MWNTASSDCLQNKVADKSSLPGESNKAPGETTCSHSSACSLININYWRILICRLLLRHDSLFWFFCPFCLSSLLMFCKDLEKRNFRLCSFLTDNALFNLFIMVVKSKPWLGVFIFMLSSHGYRTQSILKTQFILHVQYFYDNMWCVLRTRMAAL